MKRKLNEADVPTPVIDETERDERDNEEAVTVKQSDERASGKGAAPTFESFGLDIRLLQAVVNEGFATPTTVQLRAIPLALQGKDILARAKTGSGKTAAYVLPILQSLLRKKSNDSKRKAVLALLLVPTKELAAQVSKVVLALAAYCAKDVRVLNLSQKTSEEVQRSLLGDYPDVVVATPARVAANLLSSALKLNDLLHLVIDEADLVLSYGYEEDLQNIARAVPKGVQTFLMSATLFTEVDVLKGLFCRDPAILELDEKPGEENKVSQYVVKCGEDEKFLLLYVIVKLKLIKGKTIVFVSNIDRCYRVKLYLEQFGVKSCVLNSELPVNSRIHVVEQFNMNVYDIIIASDEHEIVGSKSRNAPRKEHPEEIKQTQGLSDAGMNDDSEKAKDSGIDGEDEGAVQQENTPQKAAPENKKGKTGKREKEYGISRGIDFKNVACVLNFDLPPSATSYKHRIGRTARANQTGTALSFAVPSTLYRKHKAISTASAEHDESVLAAISASQVPKHGSNDSSNTGTDSSNTGTDSSGDKGSMLRDYAFDMAQVEPFRYRTSDALRAVTRIAVREARTRELRQEILKSEKLRRHFEENPEELRHLRHDGELRAARIQPHLKHVPDYLMPKGAAGNADAAGKEIGFVGLGRSAENKKRRDRALNRIKGRGIGKKAGGAAGGRAMRVDPLKTFNARGRGKK